MEINPTRRFSNRVDDYVRYRPGYPTELVQTLQRECGLTSSSVVADIGSGTGISADLFLDLGCHVLAVEPNVAMRAAAEAKSLSRPNFVSIDGTAEATTLAACSVDLVTAGQAFHWFRPDETRREFLRILCPGGWVALFWNSRRLPATPFLQAYESLLLRYGTDYQQVNHRRINADHLRAFFGSADYQTRQFLYSQQLNWEGLRGRLMSSSYAPDPSHPNHVPILDELRSIYDRFAEDDRVAFDYDTELFFGPMKS